MQTTLDPHVRWRIVFPPYITEEEREIARLYSEGETYRRIAELTGITEMKVDRTLHRLRRHGEVGRRRQ